MKIFADIFKKRCRQTKQLRFAALRLISTFSISFLFLILSGTTSLSYGYANDVDLSKRPFRFGFSNKMFSGVNENDVVAAIKIWAAAMSKDLKMPVDPTPVFFHSVLEIEAAVRQKQVELICVLAEEYFQVKSLFPNDKTLCGVRSDSSMVSYALLTNKKDKYSTIKDLYGKTLGLSKDRGSSLGRIWLDTCLYKSGLKGSNVFFKQLNHAKRVDKLIYQLFFQQIDCCLASHDVFEIMVQLNPQIGKDLKIIASSPPVIPVVFAFRGKSDHPLVDLTFKALSHLHESPAGAQLMTLFKVDRLKIEPASVLENTYELIKAYHGIKGRGKN